MMFGKGDHVRLTIGDKSLEAIVVLASDNGRSLMLVFDGTVWLHGAMIAGYLPVLQDADGPDWSEILTGQPVQIAAIES